MRWRLAYAVHWCYALVSVGAMFIAAGAVSRENYEKIPMVEEPLSIFSAIGSVGYDSTDDQWRNFSNIAVPFVPVLLLFALVSRLFRKCGGLALMKFYVVVGLGFVAFLHGPSFFVPLLFALANYVFVVYAVRCRMPYRLFMTVMWVSQIAMLFVNSWYGDHIASQYVLTSAPWWQRRLRWVVVFNMYTLRMIAFNMDLYEAINDGAAQQERAVRKHDTTCVECAQMREAGGGGRSHSTRCYKFRTEHPRRPCEYNLLSYLAYMLYVPLYIAGPMSSFNAFVSHCHHPTVSMSLRQKVLYALRVLMIYTVLVFMLHFLFVNGFRQHPKYFLELSVPQKGYLLYFSLGFLWLKFSLVWKLSRLAACVDGIDVPEDMRRCFTNTVSVRDFWRDWHASFNLWIVRYMYIPMGGSRKKQFSIFPIFFFIAIWHDVAFYLLKWAMCVVTIFVLELIVSAAWNSPRFSHLRRSRFERHLRSIGGVFTVFGLIVANVIGFSSRNESNQGRSTEHETVDDSHSDFLSFCVLVGVGLYCVAVTGVINRDVEAVNVKRLKKRYGLVE
ncbi:glycerol uptake protein [Trypanosoma grayi]|uniref:glycerol uptake protein n=1 Tax=Trypanosoma grayi TaxID=71804 RepID=UPI0004F42579|nr:glycerol uptake protein [Trypanosoma grayi]KEG09525.1 glycerol uptake protein [Trypanosoma grayi]